MLKKILLVGLGIGVLALSAWQFSRPAKEITSLERPAYDQESAVYELEVEARGKTYSIKVPVAQRSLSQQAAERQLEKAHEELCQEILGQNSSPEQIRENMNFIQELPQYGVKVEYNLENYQYMNCFGELTKEAIPKEGVHQTIQIILYHGESQREYSMEVMLLPPLYSAEETYVKKIEQKIQDANPSVGDSDYWVLPTSLDGEKLTFYERKSGMGTEILLLLLGSILVVYYQKVYKKKKERQRREQELQQDYPDIVSKLTLLIGAGMSGSGAMSKIAFDYHHGPSPKKGKTRYAYEEIVMASNRIAMGISEEEVYSKFGRACQLHCYIKLSTMLLQNIKKGGPGFCAILRNETSEAFMERKALARKAGEEAGTKLLLPMIIMLLIVLLMIVFPAFMSF